MTLGITWLFRLSAAWIVGAIVLNDPVVKKRFWLVPVSDLTQVLPLVLWFHRQQY